MALSGGSPVAQEASEAELMRRTAEAEFGQPVRWLEGTSRTTRENAEATRALLAPEGIETICLVTHADHMGRAAAAFRTAGFAVIPAPLALPSDRPAEILDYVPQAGALADSRRAIREHLGRLWYAITED